MRKREVCAWSRTAFRGEYAVIMISGFWLSKKGFDGWFDLVILTSKNCKENLILPGYEHSA